MTELLPLRGYQNDAIKAVRESWRKGQRPAVVSATGTGKTVTFSHLIADSLDGGRAIVLVHRDELVRQAVNKLREVESGIRVGVVKAGENETDADVIVASVQTLRSQRRRDEIENVKLIVVDECFPAGTLVGGRPIESLRAGDLVPSWNEKTGREEVRPVVRVMRKKPSSLVRVSLSNGSSFVCTPNHPIMTSVGWCPAGWLPRGALVVSFTHDANANRGKLHGVRDSSNSHGEGPEGLVSEVRSDVLLQHMPGLLGPSGSIGANVTDEPAARCGTHATEQPHVPRGIKGEGVRDVARDRAQTETPGRERITDAGTSEETRGIPGMAHGGSGYAFGRPDAVALQSGHRSSDHEGSDRGGWGVPLFEGPPRLRPEKGRATDLNRVAGVQVLEPGRDGTYGGVCPDGVVHNIEVDTTHTYLIGDGVVVHNCHHAAAASYRAVLDHWSDARVVGFTATLSRQDSKSLGDVFDVVAFRYDVLDAINDGWLCDVTGRMVTVDGMSLADVTMRAGDLAAGSLSDALLTSEAQNHVVEAYTQHARRMPGIVFTPSVAATHAFTEAFGDAGYSVASVWGDMLSEDRTAALKAYSAGDLQILVNCQVLTEGFDAPRAQCAVIARPTTSAALYIQMVGRVLRPYPGKDRALVLDVVGASQEHKLATLADLSTRRISEVRPGESVMEAVRREVAARNPNLAGYVVSSEEVDLFHRSRRVWLQTHGGLWFIRVGNAVVFLWPGSEPGLYHVGLRPMQRPGGRYVKKDVSLDYAMAWGERTADDYMERWEDTRGESLSFLERRSASWRNRPANPGQLQHAEALGLPATPTMTRGQVSDAIAIHYASLVLDHGRKS